jgi:tetratricopeptide (TPR) repeat protein
MRSVYISIILLGLTACTGIGYVATSDPNKLIDQAYSLRAEDRLLLAEDVIRQAVEIAEEQEDTSAMARAYLAYGNLYMSDLYINGRWKAKFKKLGTYDGTYMKSIENFSKCQDLYKQIGNGSGEATCLAGIGRAYAMRGETDNACDYFKKSLATYNSAKQAGGNFEEWGGGTRYANFGELIKADINKEECGI